jgi:predicted Zn-dependent protease
VRRISPSLVITAIALAAIAVWPAFRARDQAVAVASGLPTPAPVSREYLQRDEVIHFWEGAVAEHHYNDMMSPRMLAAQYLQRYKENGSIDDVLRAQRAAKQSLAVQPQGNVGGDMALASTELTLHHFREALALTQHAHQYLPGDEDMSIREASLNLELGRYAQAKSIIDRLSLKARSGIAGETLLARWDELTGKLAEARQTFAPAVAKGNAHVDDYAQGRAWFYVRASELAFEAGDNAEALRDGRTALDVFPHNVDALRALARYSCAQYAWSDCLDYARRSAEIIPYPETLGYEADAQRALGDEDGARQTGDLIAAVEKVGNAQHISDRLLAVYYADHQIHTAHAYAIARRELGVRDDIFTEDTLAWTAAMDGRWSDARVAMRKALRLGTQNSLLHYHAAVIALHFGERTEAQTHLQTALALNLNFSHLFAPKAREMLAELSASAN